MSELKNKEFQDWFNSQRIVDFADPEAKGFYAFTKKELIEFTRKAWEESEKQTTHKLVYYEDEQTS